MKSAKREICAGKQLELGQRIGQCNFFGHMVVRVFSGGGGEGGERGRGRGEWEEVNLVFEKCIECKISSVVLNQIEK